MECDLPVGLRFSLLHRSFRKKMDELLREKGLTGVQFGVLGALSRLEWEGRDEINQKDLELVTHVTHPTMAAIIKRLEKKELILCGTSPRDRRFKCISSTEKARALERDVAEVEEKTFRWLCGGLSEAQIGQLMDITDVMIANAVAACGERGDCP
ncbi:MAG: MarR family transcriptional regulator [Oscillospiraceae bacterium]|nr:MarR family transcriptional regulator [Oscillospiraceae bacterium]